MGFLDNQLTDTEVKRVLLDEWQNKRPFSSKYKSHCNVKGCEIWQEETLYFYGDKKKCCGSCFAAILEYLGE